MEKDPRNVSGAEVTRAEYEPPQVLSVMDADELTREVHYAGFVQVSE
jgi:hypothetical protein